MSLQKDLQEKCKTRAQSDREIEESRASVPQEMTQECMASRETETPSFEAGWCGDGMTWRKESGVLYIEGHGEIEEGAFEEDHSIRKVVIAPGCVRIGEYAFACCTQLEEVILPDGLKYIDSSAFYACERLTLHVPRSVKQIGYHAFSGIKALEYYGWAREYGENWGAIERVEAIAEAVCSWRMEGDTLHIDGEGKLPIEKVKVWENSQVYEWRSPWYSERDQIRHVVIAPGCTEIHSQAFSCCAELETISIPQTVETIEDAAFLNCCKLRSVVIPESVAEIGCRVFEGCAGLRTVELPDSVTKIGDMAFNGCSSLESVRVPESVTEIGRKAFYGCAQLTSIEIPTSVQKVGGMAFKKCDGLSHVEISGSELEIGPWVFYECTSLTSVILREGVAKIGTMAFSGCVRLNHLELPNSLTEIGRSAFGHCAGLKHIKLPNSLTEIGSFAFCRCDSLSELRIPAGVMEIGCSAFRDLGNLTEITVDENNPCFASRDGMLFDKDMRRLICCPAGKAGRVEIPDGVVEIAEAAFIRCENLMDIHIPGSVKRIGRHAFGFCTGIRSLAIPGSVTEIGLYAFKDVAHISISNEVQEGYTWGELSRN